MTQRELTIWIDKLLLENLGYENPDELIEKYKKSAEKHNMSVSRSKCPDAGFDIFTPENGLKDTGYLINGKHMQIKLHTGIRCMMSNLTASGNDREIEQLSYYMYPRSSISKTNYRLANNVGIIDSGYRGELLAVFDTIQNLEENDIEKPEAYSRLIQICCGDLKPFKVRIETIDNYEYLKSLITERGEGGFGSTGK